MSTTIRETSLIVTKVYPTAAAGGVGISVVVPLYRTEACIDELYRRLVATLETLTPSFEIILVNDGSPQDDWRVMRTIADADPRVKAINLSRNFGQHYAISAGLEYAAGDWVVVMDGDLQDPPEAIVTLYEKAMEGHDIVFGRKPTRNHSAFRRFASRSFTKILGFLMDEKLDNAVTHFSIVSQAVIQNVRRFGERNRSYAFLLRWLGFDVAYVDVWHQPRFAGTTSYTFARSMRLALELVVSQSDKPLRLSIKFGFVTAVAAFIYGVYQIAGYLFWRAPVTGWTSVIVSIYFLSGLLFIALGVVGLYIGRIFEESKGRPLYVVREAINVTGATSVAAEGDYNLPPRVSAIRSRADS